MPNNDETNQLQKRYWKTLKELTVGIIHRLDSMESF